MGIGNILILVMVGMLWLEFHSGLDCWRCGFQMHIEGDVLGWRCLGKEGLTVLK